jgi:hypothetical protein
VVKLEEKIEQTEDPGFTPQPWQSKKKTHLKKHFSG